MALPLGPGQVPRPEGAGQGGAGPRSRGQGGTAGEASGGPRSVSGIWRGRGRGGWERGEPGGVAKGGRRARPGRGDSPLGRPSCISESVSAQPSVWQVRAGGGGARSLACRRPRSPHRRRSPGRASRVCSARLRGGACCSSPLRRRQAPAAGHWEARARRGRRGSRLRASGRGFRSAAGIGAWQGLRLQDPQALASRPQFPLRLNLSPQLVSHVPLDRLAGSGAL